MTTRSSNAISSALTASLGGPAEALQAFKQWQARHPKVLATEQDRLMFLAGHAAAMEGRVASGTRAALEFVHAEGVRRNRHVSEGVCPDCEGEGEIGGQFSGGFQACPSCNGAAKPVA